MDLSNISNYPGVYLWKDADGNIIYVGKSKCLKKRMSQYFSGTINSFKTSKMVDKIKGYETIICNNENEALILERNLIQKYKPFYNVCLLDDTKYPYINIFFNKKELLISLKYSVRSEGKYNLYYGPYLNNGGSKIILNFLRRECFYKDGLPIRQETPEFWKNKFFIAKSILSKTNNCLINELTNKMSVASEREQFEIANDLKKIIQFFRSQKDTQIVEIKDRENIDIIFGIEHNNFIVFCIQFYRSGSLINNSIYPVEINITKKDTIRQFINQFYKNKQLPIKIVTNLTIAIDDIYFKTNILIPKSGKYFKILDLCKKNAEQNIDFKIMEYENKRNTINNGLIFLKEITNIQNLNHIIMIDNSSTNNTNPISAIISYRNGLAEKNEYRKFNIQRRTRSSDVEYIKQGLEQYFKSSTDNPDLLIVDGGIHQLNEAKKTLKEMNINKTKIIGLVKNKQHKTAYVCSNDGNKIKIKDEAYVFLSGIQYEVDRFAKTVHRNKNSKTSLEGKLIKINGIGVKTEQKILNHFKTYNNIYNATCDELEKVVSKKIAKLIVEKLK